MLYEQGAVSRKPWEPVGHMRRRPAWVQTTVFDLLRQVRALRIATAKLPSIDIISLPSHRQLAVSFGDLNALCDSIVSAPPSCSGMIVSGHSVLNPLGIRSPSLWSARRRIRGSRRQRYAVDQILQGKQAAMMQQMRANNL